MASRVARSELHTPCGAGQGHPQLLVQLRQVGDIGPGADHHLIDAPCANKLPSVLLCMHSAVQPLCPVLPLLSRCSGAAVGKLKNASVKVEAPLPTPHRSIAAPQV